MGSGVTTTPQLMSPNPCSQAHAPAHASASVPEVATWCGGGDDEPVMDAEDKIDEEEYVRGSSDPVWKERQIFVTNMYLVAKTKEEEAQKMVEAVFKAV